jgi:mono/diheme cytochrome c family protein
MRLPRHFISAAVLLLGVSRVAAAEVPDFNRDIRPILSDKCFRCHGPDEHERKGGEDGLRLDTAKGALTDLGGGAFAIVPGKPEKSELIARVTTADEEEIMPPLKAGKTLTKEEIDLLRRWIASGGSYAQHWAYEAPRRTSPPAVRNKGWAKGAVDQFILARLEKEKLSPQPEADRATLARRVTLDLTGLPPTLQEVV